MGQGCVQCPTLLVWVMPGDIPVSPAPLLCAQQSQACLSCPASPAVTFLLSPCPPLYPRHFRNGCHAAAPVLVGQPRLLLKMMQWPAKQQAEGAAEPMCLLPSADCLPQGEGGPWFYGSSFFPMIKVLVCSHGTASLRL